MAEKVDRLTRVNALLKRELAEAIERDLVIPSGMLVSVTEVNVSVDLRNATVYVSIFGGKASDRQAVMHGLAEERLNLQSRLGRTLAFKPDEADLYVINTCAFIPAARDEAREAIEDGIAWKQEKPGRLLVVAGCLTEWDKDGSVRKEYPEVDLWTGVNQVAEIARLLDRQSTLPENAEEPVYLYDDCTPRLQLTLPHLAYLKIADGCNNRCTYCSIPGIRGRLRTRPMESVVREARNLIEGGVRELLVIAQDITVYGNDRPESGDTLARLLTALNALEGNFVIRLLYTHPAHYTEEFIDFMARGNTKVLPYLDIPLQHISDRILKQMNRHVTRKQTEELLTKLRERIPGLTLRTTFITGFPGETEEEYQELKSFAKKFKFERCGVFPYSPEPRTPAAAFPDQVPAELGNYF